jgi:hypothetical protein
MLTKQLGETPFDKFDAVVIGIDRFVGWISFRNVWTFEHLLDIFATWHRTVATTYTFI